MGFFTWFAQRVLDNFVLDTSRTISLIILSGTVSILGILVYIFAGKLFHVNELEDYQRYLLKFTKYLKR